MKKVRSAPHTTLSKPLPPGRVIVKAEREQDTIDTGDKDETPRPTPILTPTPPKFPPGSRSSSSSGPTASEEREHPRALVQRLLNMAKDEDEPTVAQAIAIARSAAHLAVETHNLQEMQMAWMTGVDRQLTAMVDKLDKTMQTVRKLGKWQADLIAMCAALDDQEQAWVEAQVRAGMDSSTAQNSAEISRRNAELRVCKVISSSSVAGSSEDPQQAAVWQAMQEESQPDLVTQEESHPDHVTHTEDQPDHVTQGADHPDHVTPEESKPDHVTPVESKPDHVTQKESQPDRVTPEESLPDHVTQGESQPLHVTLEESQPLHVTPGEALPAAHVTPEERRELDVDALSADGDESEERSEPTDTAPPQHHIETDVEEEMEDAESEAVKTEAPSSPTFVEGPIDVPTLSQAPIELLPTLIEAPIDEAPRNPFVPYKFQSGNQIKADDDEQQNDSEDVL